MRAMENRSRLVAIVLVAVLAIVGGFAAGALLTGNRASPTESPSGEAQVSEAPSDAESEAASGETTEPDTESEEPTDEESSAASASPTSAPAPTANITFERLMVDAADDPGGADRILTWNSATGSVTAEVTSVSPMGDLEMCLSTPDKELGCRTAGSGTLSAKTTKSRETFILTLRGEGTAQPVVDVALAFPARKPKVTIENARFDGTAYPDTNGIQAVFTPRANGNVGMTAEWGGHPFFYEIDLMEQGGSGSLTYQPEQGNIGTDVHFAVTAPNPWKLVLQNTETGFGVTPMTASISWP
jgi:cytoskeletal protein RodZ